MGDPKLNKIIDQLKRRNTERGYVLHDDINELIDDDFDLENLDAIYGELTRLSISFYDSEAVRPAILEAQRGLLRLGLSGPPWVERLRAGLEPADFDPGPPRRLFEALREASDAAHGGGWLDGLAAEEDRSFATELALEELPLGEPEKLFGDYVVALKGARLEAAELELQRRLAAAAGSGDREAEDRLLVEQRSLAQERSRLRKRGTGEGPEVETEAPRPGEQS